MSRPLRIAMVCDIVPGQTGGSYISTVRFAKLLTERGHHVILVGSRDRREPPVTTYEGLPMFQFFALPTPGSGRTYFQSFPTKRALKKLFIAERIDLVHIMFPSYSCAVAKRVARTLDLPIVAHVHTQPENLYNFLPHILRRRFVFNAVLNYLVRFVKNADRVIFPSELGRDVYQAVAPQIRAEVVSNGVDLTHFHEVNTDDFLKRYALDPDQTYLLFVGRLMEDKDVATLIRAMKALRQTTPRAHILLVGTGPLAQSLRQLAQIEGVSEHVSFLGRISDEDRLAVYSACSLFVLPSHVELEGMVVLEAMACGKPILIANASTSASRFFVDGNGALFAPGDADDLAQKAHHILDDAGVYQAMSKKSRSNAERFDIHESAKRLESIYESVVNSRA